LPSPLETAMLIKRAGANFNRTLLNPVANIGQYNSNLKMALNLGIYSADLSYSSLFDQTQTTIEYMGNAKKLAENLGIMGSIDETTIRKLEENMNNRDAVMDIISETFMSSNAYLSENNRAAISVMVLAGGWIEGLYLATQLSRDNMENNERLIDRIVYQKLSLYTLLNMMESYDEDPHINMLIDKFKQLRVIYDDIKIVNTSDVEASTNAEKQVTTIKAQSKTYMEPAVFEDLCKKVEELRSDFVS
jgi:1,2-phenylacetyl-CoA epoxidase PaaB subunit